MKKILLLICACALISPSASALVADERVLLYAVLDRIQDNIQRKTTAQQTKTLSDMITALHVWSREKEKNYDLPNRTKNVVEEILKFLCVKRMTVTGYACPEDVYKPNRIYDAENISENDAKNHLLKLQNQMRVDYLRSVLHYDKHLTQAAQNYANVLCATNHFDHTGPDGSTMAERAQEAGYKYRALAENLAYGFSNAEMTLMHLWTSKSHRDNLLKPTFIDVGIGYCDKYWVVLYGKK